MSRIAKTLACVLTATAVTAVAPRAHADDDNEVTLENLGRKAENPGKTCLTIADALLAKGTAPSTVVPTRESYPALKQGSTLGELRELCHAQTGKDILKSFSGPVSGAAMLFELKSFDPKDPNKVSSLEPYVRACNGAVDDALKFGIDPATVIDMSWGESKWSGPLRDVKAKVCAQGDAALKAAVDAQLAPYREQGIAGDKLDMIAHYFPLGFYIPGGSYSEGDTDPKLLKKANVWFVISEGDYCGDDKIEYHFMRYQFGKDQKIAKTSEKTYCGDPGAKAVR
ncbi:MAG: hypothetical protein K8W52_14430 [Deltaproteobacteria bacterium]|nr:hypothetical protein [Deltaproteobacteria bacterium]